VITAAHAAVVVELTTGEGHTHTASLTAAEVVQMAGNQRVTRTDVDLLLEQG
jgi:preprotein translocase subunit SecA